MVYDPAWSMPQQNWVQQGSYENKAIPPSVSPDAGEMVCLPPIAREWLPYVQGCLDQMRNPSSWRVDDDDQLNTTLNRVDRLRQLFGQFAPCMSYQLRFAECELQYSTDGGTTWLTVDGWATGFPACIPPQTELRLNANCNLQESFDNGATWPNVPGWADNFRDCTRLEVGPPPPLPYPPTLPPADQACAIATHLAQAVIRGSMQQAVTSINATDSLITFGVALLGLIPGIDLVAAGVLGGGAALYEYINAGRISAFNTAVASDSYFNDMVCRIQAVIASTGYITPANWPAVLSAIGTTPYSDGDVQFAAGQFAASLGFSGANELQQVGTLTVGDCSSCGGFCYRWGPDSTDLCNGNWIRYTGDANCGVCSGNQWTAGHGDGFYCLVLDLALPAIRNISAVHVSGAIDNEYYHMTLYDAPGGTVLLDTTLRTWDGDVHGVGAIRINVQQNNGPLTITAIAVGGSGGNPWGADNCG